MSQLDAKKNSAWGDSQGANFSRRKFLDTGAATLVAGACGLMPTDLLGASTMTVPKDPVRELLKQAVLKKEWVDRFLDPSAHVWAKFHPKYGYLLRNTFMRDGVDSCFTIGRYEATGQRHQVNFPKHPCRINTYGDSFTQGHQVSDGETWQEVLAAHFCEPIRNFGIGGFGVYQAYQRLREIESTELGTPYVVFNMWGDDHLRSIMAWRWLSFPPEVAGNMAGEMFHANPWDYVRLDPDNGALIEKSNHCPTPESLYQLCDEDFVYEAFHDDEVVHVLAALRYGRVVRKEPLERMASAINFSDLNFSNPELTKKTVDDLHHAYATRVSMRIVEDMQRYLFERGKKLFVLLSHPAGSVWHHCAGRPANDPNHVEWHPRVLQEFLAKQEIPFIDTVENHVREFRTFQMDAKQYVDRYYIGHYNPQGNHFFAFAIKPQLVEWLDPKPPAYQGGNDLLIRFEGYLPS